MNLLELLHKYKILYLDFYIFIIGLFKFNSKNKIITQILYNFTKNLIYNNIIVPKYVHMSKYIFEKWMTTVNVIESQQSKAEI